MSIMSHFKKPVFVSDNFHSVEFASHTRCIYKEHFLQKITAKMLALMCTLLHIHIILAVSILVVTYLTITKHAYV